MQSNSSCRQPAKVVHDYYSGQAFLRDGPLGGMGWECCLSRHCCTHAPITIAGSSCERVMPNMCLSSQQLPCRMAGHFLLALEHVKCNAIARLGKSWAPHAG